MECVGGGGVAYLSGLGGEGGGVSGEISFLVVIRCVVMVCFCLV